MSLIFFLYLPNHSSRHMALGSTQPLTNSGIRKSLWVVKRGRRSRLISSLPFMNQLFRKCKSPESHMSMGVHGLLQGHIYFTYEYMGHAVAQLVEALCYKLEGRGFESRCHRVFQLPNSSSRTTTLGLNQSLTKMSTRNFPGGEAR
jgi:hypothetical protein